MILLTDDYIFEVIQLYKEPSKGKMYRRIKERG